MAVLQSLQQEPAGESSFADTSWAHEHQILVLGNKVEFGESADLLAVDAGLRSMHITLRDGGVTWRGTFYPLAELRRKADKKCEIVHEMEL